MRGVTEAKGLGDVRTAISHRVRATPPQKGTTYLEMYLLDKERQRLEKELSQLDHRRGRVDERLAEIRRGLEALEQAARAAGLAAAAGPGPAGAAGQTGAEVGPGEGKWRRMTVSY